MPTNDKFIEDLKAGGYIPGDLSTLPSDISDADRRKVEQYEADRANEAVKGVQGQEPPLGKYHVELNPNQYGFAERAGAGESPMKTEKANPLDHDHDGRSGGHIDNRGKAAKK